MNSLSLRVSSIKTAENIRKNAEIRTSIVVLPASFKASKIILETFSKAATIPNQISVVKDVNASISYSMEEKIEFLAELYFNSPLKHPVRNQCCKLIQKHSKNELVSCKLKSAIISLLGQNDNLKYSSNEELNFIVTSLSGCFENFKVAKEALKDYVQTLVEFAYNAIQKYQNHISSVTSPSIKNELYLFIHNSVRIILSCVQEFSEKFKDSDMLIINSLSEMGIDMIKDAYMPMDIKTNIGILMAYIAQITQNYDDWLDDIINFEPKYTEEYLNNCFQLCACIGVINTLKERYAEMNLDKIYSIIEKVSSIANQHSTESNMLLAATRSLLQFSKIVLSFNIKEKLDEIVSCCQLLLNYTFSYLDHHMDSVRHITRDLLRNILSITSKYKLNKFLDEIYEHCIQNEDSLTIKCLLISNIVKVFGTQNMIEIRYKNIFTDLFADDNFEKDINVGNCLESLILTSLSEIGLQKWQDIYIDFLIRKTNTVKDDLKYIYENLLNKCVKFAPELTEYLLKQKSKDIQLNIKLSVLHTVRKNGLKSGCFNPLTYNLSDLSEAFLSISDDTKISALRLIAESHKTTEELTEFECNSILFYLRYNSNCQSPSTRQKTLSLSLKLITRLDVNLRKIIKIGRHENEFRNLHFYFTFLKDLLELLFANLFDGANFSRRFVSLELLKRTLEVIRDNKLNFKNFILENSLNMIFAFLRDSYEINKTLALEILKMFVDAKCGRLIMLESSFTNLVISVKPTDSITAAFYLELYCYVCDVEQFKKFFKFEINFPLPQYKPVEYCALKMVMGILSSGLNNGKISILLAAVTNPLYGCLLTIKHILSKLDFHMLAQEDFWRILINDIIIINKNASEIVGPIVNNSSPEGHFPSDFNEFPEDFKNNLLAQSAKESNSNIKNIKSDLQPTPQMVLICAWRTIKEVSLILGELALRSPIQNNSVQSTEFLLTSSQILEIGDHFKLLLSETKHRGAFEQAYVGFTKLCSRLWRVDQPELNSLPMQWLMELINIISSNEKVNEKICATRRSAGVPFMVQALITSELQVGTTKALKKCMKFLFDICNQQDYSTESKTHSLNILRALFRCTDLNEVCSEYISEGISCAIQGYNGSTWSERNSSTLLFAALITRIFGVQRTKDTENLNIRNKMTGRIFFLRYPKLFDFFLNELKEANRQIECNEKANKLHPLLLILSRLYPSALEGTESHLKISMFILYVSPCSASRELQTRVLIAKAIVAFIPLDLMEERIYEVLGTIKINLSERKGLNPNYFHGLLLQILFILKSLKCKSLSLVEDIVNDLLHYEHLLKLNPVAMRTIFDIFIEILKWKEIQHAQIVNELRHLKDSTVYKTPLYSRFYPIFRKSFCIFKLQFNLINLKEVQPKEYWENQLIGYKNNNFLPETFEETETYLNVILMILFNKSSDFEQLIEEFECHKYEVEFINTFSKEFIASSAEYFKSSSTLISIMKGILHLRAINSLKVNPELIMKSFAILSQIYILENFNLNEIIDYSKQYPNDLQNSIALMVLSLLEKNKLNIFENEIMILEYIKVISQSWNSFSARLTSSIILKHLRSYFMDSIQNKNEIFITEFSSVVLCLLMDDDVDVKENTSKFVIEFCPAYSKKYDNVVSTFAQQIFIERLTELLSQYSNYDIDFVRRIFHKIISILEGDCNKAYKEENNDFEVFDKNEVNIFAEPRKVVLDCSKAFFEKFREQLIT